MSTAGFLLPVVRTGSCRHDRAPISRIESIARAGPACRIKEKWLPGSTKLRNSNSRFLHARVRPGDEKRKRDRDHTEALRLADEPQLTLRDRAVALARECAMRLLIKVGHGVYPASRSRSAPMGARRRRADPELWRGRSDTWCSGLCRRLGQVHRPLPLLRRLRSRRPTLGPRLVRPQSMNQVRLFHYWTDTLTVLADGHDIPSDVRADLAAARYLSSRVGSPGSPVMGTVGPLSCSIPGLSDILCARP
jgi:hypothetical protein